MSFTAAYSNLRRIEDGDVYRESMYSGFPRIRDPDGFESVPDHIDMGEDTFQRIAVTGEEEDHGSYPKQTWDVLKGFKSWTPRDAFGVDHTDSYDDLVKQIDGHLHYRSAPLGYVFNIERLGIPYSGLKGSFKIFWEEVSKHTDPFAFWHSPAEHDFPGVTDFGDGTASVYYCEAHGGDLYVEEQSFARTGTEPLLTDAERVGSHETTSNNDE